MLAVSMGKASDEVVVMDVDANEDSDLSQTIQGGDLEYIHFLHSLVMLGKLSLYSAGRRCFPIEVADPYGSLRQALDKNLLMMGSLERGKSAGMVSARIRFTRHDS